MIRKRFDSKSFENHITGNEHNNNTDENDNYTFYDVT